MNALNAQQNQQATQSSFNPQTDIVKLIDEDAISEANKLASSNVNSTQIRRYFHEIKEIYHQLKNSENPDELYQKKAKFKVKMLKSKAAYDANRQSNWMPKALQKFITNGVTHCNDYDTFEKFVFHFEAVLGFFYEKENENKRSKKNKR